MEDEFLKYIKEYSLFSKENKLLVAVSGGADSITLIHLLYNNSFTFDVAHCNFGLRGKESDKDENFVRKLAKKYGVQFYSKKFDAKIEFKNKKESIQMIARDLRYNWFEKTRRLIKADFILTAHQKDDDIETFFFNLIRGTGIRGLLGIPRINNRIIRPLLFSHKKDIVEYINLHALRFREDSSNKSKKYLRNKIRHNLIPVIMTINSGFTKTFIKEKKIFEGFYQIFQEELEKVRETIIIKHNNYIEIPLNKLKKLNPLNIYLYDLLLPFGFSQTEEIISAISGESGKQFYSKTHRIVIDRETLIISPNISKQESSYTINKDCKNIKEPISLEFKVTNQIQITSSDNIANLDFDKLQFPLILRTWKKGDKFMPLGMNRNKKLSDFFIDNKISIIQKESIWILFSNNEVVWIIGHRIDNRFKISQETKKMYIASLLP